MFPEPLIFANTVRCWSRNAVLFVRYASILFPVSSTVLIGPIVFRNQAIDIHEQLELARYFGPLHKHPTTPVPRESGLEEVHGKAPNWLLEPFNRIVPQWYIMIQRAGGRTLPPFLKSSYSTAM